MVRWDYTDLTASADAARRPAGLRGSTSGVAVDAEELIGTMFTTPKQLRHLVEQQTGELFVPARVLEESPFATRVALRLPHGSELIVHAERSRHWYPFRVTRVETRAAS